jgi:hypothetical protein
MSSNTVINILHDGANVYADESIDFSKIDSLADAIGYFYKGQVIQVYWGENGGTTHYSDYDVSQNLYIEGKVLWGRKTVFALEVDVKTPSKEFKTVVVFNDWNIQFVSPVDGVDIMTLFKGNRMRRAT